MQSTDNPDVSVRWNAAPVRLKRMDAASRKSVPPALSLVMTGIAIGRSGPRQLHVLPSLGDRIPVASDRRDPITCRHSPALIPEVTSPAVEEAVRRCQRAVLPSATQ